MKTYRIIALLVVSCMISTGLSAQTADGVINDYLSALGGKAKLNKITSLKMSSQISSDMFEGNAVTTVLNGKGYKMEMDVMGYLIETCFTETKGWQTDPMAGSVVDMPEDQYKMGRGSIYVAGPFDKYKDLGFKSEYVGRADVNGVNTHQVRLTVDGTDIATDHFFDPDSHLLIRTTAVVESQGMEMKAVTDYKDYKEVEGGIKMAMKQEIDYGGQMSMTNTIGSVEVNVPVDPAIFESK
jgi:zinc protease